jgi:hypothetical protein
MGEFECIEFRFNANKHTNVGYYALALFLARYAKDVLRNALHRFYQGFFILKMTRGLSVHTQI